MGYARKYSRSRKLKYYLVFFSLIRTFADRMKILILNTSERTGGAAVAANRLMKALINNGVKAKMLVREKETDTLTVAELPKSPMKRWNFLWERLVVFCHLHFSKKHLFEVDIANAGTDITKLREFKEADIIHLHWINQGMLSLSNIRKILRSGKPVVWTMHDIWPATAICHLTLGCSNFRTACKNCKYLPGGGGNRGNQLIQPGGSLNSLAATLTPMLVGMLVGETTEKTSLEVVQPLLFIAIAIFLISFCIIYFTRIQEPDTEAQNVVNGVKGAMSYRHLVLGIIAIFFYVGIEVGIPGQLLFYLTEPVAEGGVLGSAPIAGTIAGIYWLLMLVGRFSSSLISGKVSPRAQLIFTSTLAIVLLLAAIIMPEDIKMTLKGADVPVKVLFIIICGICTSVMWGVIFNLATEGLGKFTAAASGLFMTMVVGGGVMPLIQNFLADQIGDIQSYWLVIAMLGYLLFYALIGSKPVKKEA